MQNPGTDRPATPNNAYCPSVPISVYRELSAELQAAQAMLEVLNNQNQQLLQQNQRLYQEINKVIQSTQNLQQIAAGIPPSGPGMHALSGSSLPVINSKITGSPEFANSSRSGNPPALRQVSRGLPFMAAITATAAQAITATAAQAITATAAQAIAPEAMITEQEEGRNRRPSSPRAADINGWMLLVAVLLIILTAFGTSFLIIRPLFSGNNPSR